MSRTPYVLLLALSHLAACHHQPPSAPTPPSPPDLNLVASILDATAAVPLLGVGVALERGDAAACFGSSATSAAFRAAAAAVRSAERREFPALVVDVRSCLDLAAWESVEVPPSVGPAVDGTLALAEALVGAARLECEPQAWARAAIEYARGASPAILSELAEPDGYAELPAVAVAECVAPAPRR